MYCEPLRIVFYFLGLIPNLFKQEFLREKISVLILVLKISFNKLYVAKKCAPFLNTRFQVDFVILILEFDTSMFT